MIIILVVIYLILSLISLFFTFSISCVGKKLYYKKEMPYSIQNNFAFLPKIVNTWRTNQQAFIWLQSYNSKSQGNQVFDFYTNKLGIFSITF